MALNFMLTDPTTFNKLSRINTLKVQNITSQQFMLLIIETIEIDLDDIIVCNRITFIILMNFIR